LLSNKLSMSVDLPRQKLPITFKAGICMFELLEVVNLRREEMATILNRILAPSVISVIQEKDHRISIITSTSVT